MVKVCCVQAEPVWFDLQESVKKTIKLIEEAGKNKVELIAFPEVFIPGYPIFLWNNATSIPENVSYINNSLTVNSDEFKSICNAAKENSIIVILGFSENDRGSIYISQAIIDRNGETALIRRKFKSTHVERVLFGDGTSNNVRNVIPLSIGGKKMNIGALNCWEHAQPLLTYYGAIQNEEVHIASWPPLACHKEESDFLYSLSNEGARALCVSYAIQNGCFCLSATGVISEKLIDKIGPLPALMELGGGSAMIYGPDGREYAKRLPPNVEGLVIADIDDSLFTVNKHFIHSTGHYSRPDMFSLNVHKPNNNHYNEIVDKENLF